MAKQIRKFWLRSPDGDLWPLNGERAVYLTDPAGLGFERDPTFTPLGQGFFRRIGADEDVQANPACTLVFTGPEPYATYQQLLAWVARAGNVMELVYCPHGSTEYSRGVELTSIEKGELNAVGWLSCPTVMTALGPWALPQPTRLEMDAAAATAMSFPLVFDSNLVFGPDSADVMAADIVAAGHVAAGLVFRYTGAAVNPRIILTGKHSGTRIGVCDVTATLEDGDTLELSTRYEDSHIYKLPASGGVVDLVDELDITRNPFMHIPTSEPCTISMEAGSDITGTATVTIYYYYRSV